MSGAFDNDKKGDRKGDKKGPKPVIAVIGGSDFTSASLQYRMDVEVGYNIVQAGYRLLTGGLGGVMEVASKIRMMVIGDLVIMAGLI